MNISPNEAEEALAAIQRMTQKTRHSIASSGAYIFLIVTGIVWLVGFLSTQFLTGEIVGYIWTGTEPPWQRPGHPPRHPDGQARPQPVDSRRRQSESASSGCSWSSTALPPSPSPGRRTGSKLTMFIILFIMLGQLAMGLLLSFSSVWWALPITALALVGYFLLPGIFYLWMGVLGGGGMIALGLYIRSRW